MSDNREPDSHQAESDASVDAASTEEKWEDPVLPPDDFSDKESSAEVEDDEADEEPKRGKSGVLIFALLGAVALAGAGGAYLHFGTSSGDGQKSISANAQEVASVAKTAAQSAQAPVVVAEVPPVAAPTIQTPSIALPGATAPEVVAPVKTTAPEIAAPALPVVSDPQVPASTALPVLAQPPVAPQVAEASVAPPVGSNDQQLHAAAAVPAVALPATTPDLPTPSLPVEQPAAAQNAVATPIAADAGHKGAVTPVAPAATNVVETPAAKPPETIVGQVPASTAVATPPPVAVDPSLAKAPEIPPVHSQGHSQAESTHEQVPAVASAELTEKKVAAQSAAHEQSKDTPHAKVKSTKSVSPEQKHHVATAKTVKPAKAKAQTAKSKKPLPYLVRSVMQDEAWLADKGHSDALLHVKIGDTVPGLGKLVSIREEEHGWRIVGTAGVLYDTTSEDR